MKIIYAGTLSAGPQDSGKIFSLHSAPRSNLTKAWRKEELFRVFVKAFPKPRDQPSLLHSVTGNSKNV